MAVSIGVAELAAAFASRAFFHEYQPVVRIETGSVHYVEALVRWAHPRLGVVQPAAFLPLVYRANLSDRLTDFCVRQALEDLPLLRDQYGQDVSVGVNLSQSQLRQPGVTAGWIADALDHHGESPRALRIEVVEDLRRPSMRPTTRAFADLRASGVAIMLDDFGTGASSLTALTEMGYDGLKIDRSFVRGTTSSTTARSVVEAVLAFGRSANIEVVAEGVETARELQLLREMGVEFCQGFHLSAPKKVSEHELTLDLVTEESPLRIVAVDDETVSRIVREVQEIQPRSMDSSFDEKRANLERLHDEAATLGLEGDILRTKIGVRLTLAAVYAGETEYAHQMAMQTSQLAERIDEWGHSAHVLAIIAAYSPYSDGQGSVNIDILVRALQIRLQYVIEGETANLVDNAIGATLTNLGLHRHAQQWWLAALERVDTTADRGTAMICLNLCEGSLSQLEGEEWYSSATPAELTAAHVDQIIGLLGENPHVVEAAAATYRSRLLIFQGHIDEAAAAIEGIGLDLTDYLSVFLVLKARCLLARARHRWSEFLEHTTALIDHLGGDNLMTHSVHHMSGQRLHIEALEANDRHREAAASLRQLFERQLQHGAEGLITLFGWIRLHVDMNVLFEDLLEVSTPVGLSGLSRDDPAVSERLDLRG